MSNLHLKIVSPDKIMFEGKVVFIKFPGTEGVFSFLSNHAPLVSSLDKGLLHYRLEGGEENSINITSGFVEVNNNRVTVCIEGIN